MSVGGRGHPSPVSHAATPRHGCGRPCTVPTSRTVGRTLSGMLAKGGRVPVGPTAPHTILPVVSLPEKNYPSHATDV